MALNNYQSSIITTLLYSDMFNFPLTEEELWRNLITSNSHDRNTLLTTTESLRGFITSQKGFFCLKGKEQSIIQRKQRASITTKKLKIAKTAARYLSYIPTIRFIGLTGRLSHMDADIEDDIDLFFITKKNTVWISRLMILAILELLNLRRTRNEKNPKDKICPNLLIDETALTWPPEKQDIFTAHEIVNIYPLFSKYNTFQKFIKSNKWISQFYANSGFNTPDLQQNEPKKYFLLKIINIILTSAPAEYVAGKFQKKYMGTGKNQAVRSNFLAFYPPDRRKLILHKFRKKIRKFQPKLRDYRVY